jgi:hypothetical protein
LKSIGFLKSYHGGKWDGVNQVAAMIRKNIPADQTIFGPEATVLTYLSERKVFGLGRFLPRKDRGGKWDRILHEIKPQFACAIFPDTTDKLYDDKDVVTGKLIRLGVLKPTRTIATAAGYKLCEYEIVKVAKKKKTKHHDRNIAAATQPKPRRHRAPKTPTTKAITHPATAPTRHGLRGATTQPAK